MAEEKVILVDANDNQVGLMEKMEAHEKALLHRAFSVFLVRRDGNQWSYLLQQRAKDKYHCGGLWTNSCCSHQRENETSEQAGKRRVREELGLDVELMELGNFTYRAEFDNGLTEHELDHVLVGLYEGDSIPFNREEVEDVRWMNLEEIYTESNRYPERFTPWFKLALDIVRKNISKFEQQLAAQEG